jgi:hypothetical protein
LPPVGSSDAECGPTRLKVLLRRSLGVPVATIVFQISTHREMLLISYVLREILSIHYVLH